MPRPYTDLSNPPRLDAPIGTRFIPLRRDVIFVICDDLQNLRLGIPSVPGFPLSRDFRRQPSRPVTVPLRCLLAGRGMPRPYTDLSNPLRLDAPRAATTTCYLRPERPPSSAR